MRCKGCVQQGESCYSYATSQDESCSAAPSSSWQPSESSAPSASVGEESMWGPILLSASVSREMKGGAQADSPQQRGPSIKQRKGNPCGGEPSARNKVAWHSEGQVCCLLVL
jgi:hypothetical protein